MAQIPRAALDLLTQQVNAISADAQAKVLEVLEAVEWTPGNVARCREIVAEALASVIPAYADASAQAAADFYDAARELCAGEAIGAAALSGLDMAAVQGAVRALVQVVVDGGAKERFDREVLGRVDVEMKKAAANSIVENAAKDPAKPRWARVPSGRETCPFCLMLASFGFNTGSKEAASHTHANCDCRIVPQWGDGSVGGYDPDGMYGRYNACLDAIGGRDGVRREWDALPKEEREAYVAKHGGKAGKAFDAFLNKRVSAEIGRRDPEWFRTGKVPEYSAEPGAKPDRFEKQCGAVLRANGFPVDFRKTAGTCPGGYKKRTSDVFVGKTPWEMKNPESNNDKTVKNQLKKAVGMAQKEMQSSRVIISNVRSGRSADQMAEDAKKLFADGRFIEIDEVLVVGSDGTVLRIKR